MEQAEFEALLKPNAYQVFLFSCPPSMPLSFACHPWFVVNKKRAASRYEVIASPAMYNLKCHGHLCVDALPPWRGLRILRSWRHRGYIWPSKLLYVLEGDEHSLAARMAEFIENSPQSYPYRNRYAYTGPNSNTYAQWVLNHFPDSGLKLPWNSFGQNYRANQ